MFFANFWNFRELKTELKPQRSGGVRPDPSGWWGPARADEFFFFAIRKVTKNNDFTWVLDET